MAESALRLPIDALCERLRRRYVFADRVEAMCRALRAPAPPGLEGAAAAAWLTGRLQSVSPDRHLRVRWFDRLAQPDAPGDGDAARHDAARADRFGVVRAELLDQGRIGWVEISEFYPPHWIAEAVAQAMTALAGARALVFDLRRCRGGEPGGVAWWASCLFGAQPVHLNELYLRTEDRIESWWTRPDVPGPRFVDEPVFVLTSASTFSAAEEFAYDLQALGRATIVGEVTRGGANPGSIHPLDEHFAVFVPDARAVNPLTGDNWEGRGVMPDHRCAADEAPALARKLAHDAIAR